MKPLIKFAGCIYMLSFFSSCSLNTDPVVTDDSFPLSSAHDFFTTKCIEYNAWKDDPESVYNCFNPGEFTPLWEKAVVSENDYVKTYEVPLYTENSYMACSVDNPNERFSIFQKLAVFQNKKSKTSAMLLLTVIPNTQNDQEQLQISAFTAGETYNFSGIVIYSLPVINQPGMLEVYTEGVLMKRLCFFGGSNTIEQNIEKIERVLSCYNYWGYKTAKTRNAEEWITSIIGYTVSLPFELLGHYILNYGENYVLDGVYWENVSSTSESIVGSDYANTERISAGEWVYHRHQVSFYGTTLDLAASLGVSTVFFDTLGNAIDIFDIFDFNSMSSGQRSFWAELSVSLAALIPGTSFAIIHGPIGYMEIDFSTY